MKDELFKKVIEIIEKTETFVVGQAPDVVQQFFNYELWLNKATLYLGIAFIIVGVLAFFISLPFDDEWWLPIVAFFIITLIMAGPICIWVGYTDLKKLEIAPKVYLIDKVGSYKGGNK